MLSRLKPYHGHIYYFGLILLVVSLPLSIYFTSVAEILILVNWILEGGFRQKFKSLRKQKAVLWITGIYIVHLLGIIYTETANYDYLLKDLKVKLPILVLPVLVASSPKLNPEKLHRLLILFCLATFSSTLISFMVFLGVIPYEYYDFRDISIFISHIRLALMVNLSIFILIYYLFNPLPGIRYRKLYIIFSIPLVLWFLFFMVLLKSLTGLIIFAILFLVLIWIYSGRVKDVAPRFIIRSLLLAIPLLAATYISHSVGRFFYREPIDFNSLEEFTAEGNPYLHDTTSKAVENGSYTYIYISEKELRREWNRISSFDYDGLDKKDQEIKYTLIRYLTSLGLKKDAEGVRQLNAEDIRAIENGKANVIFRNRYSLYPRIYEVMWEIDGYLRGGDPSGHSIAQRIAYLDAAIYIFRNNPVIGVGTGDVQSSFNRYYEKTNSLLDKNYRRRAHNQYATFLLTFGMVGFLLIMVCLLVPVFLERKWRDYFFIVFFIISFLSMLNEDTLETQTGVSFFIFFYSLFLFGRTPKGDNHGQKIIEKGH